MHQGVAGLGPRRAAALAGQNRQCRSGHLWSFGLSRRLRLRCGPECGRISAPRRLWGARRCPYICYPHPVRTQTMPRSTCPHPALAQSESSRTQATTANQPCSSSPALGTPHRRLACGLVCGRAAAPATPSHWTLPTRRRSWTKRSMHMVGCILLWLLSAWLAAGYLTLFPHPPHSPAGVKVLVDGNAIMKVLVSVGGPGAAPLQPTRRLTPAPPFSPRPSAAELHDGLRGRGPAIGVCL